MVGSLEASRSSGSVNAAIPALLVGSADNNDVKVPMRLPITTKTHEATCTANCVGATSRAVLVDAMEASQAAQVGYFCDYCNKRHPCGVWECNEWSKGHVKLEGQMKGDHLSHQARKDTK